MKASQAVQNQSPFVLVAHLGARRHYAIPAGIQQGGLLGQFCTDLYLHHNSSLLRVGNWWARQPWAPYPHLAIKMLGRRAPTLRDDKVTAFNILGFAYAAALRVARRVNRLERCDCLFGQLFARSVVHTHHLRQAEIVYGLNAASLELFQSAKRQGIKCVLEQVSAPRSIEVQLLDRERQKWPGWDDLGSSRLLPQGLAEREEKEWSLADLIVAGSQFVVDGLVSCGISPDRCQVVPYAVPPEFFAERLPAIRCDGPARVLFAGGVGIQKGIQYVYEAAKLLDSPSLEVRAVGPIHLSKHAQRLVSSRIQLAGPVPRSEMPAQYHNADIFVFPSVCEGSALVIYEALARGLPVITTPNAGSIVRDGIDGYIVPMGDAETLADRILRLAREPGLCQEMSMNAHERAKEASWERYAQRVCAALLSLS